METFAKWTHHLFILFLFGALSLNEALSSSDVEREAKKARTGTVPPLPSPVAPPSIVEKEWGTTEKYSIWKRSLNFSHTPYSPAITVDDWHQEGSRVIPAIQRELASASRNTNINVAIAGLQCIYREDVNDNIGITKIVNLPKLFVSGCKSTNLNFSEIVSKACRSFPGGDVIAQEIKQIHNGLYGVGDGYIYSRFDQGYLHLRSYMEQNFNLWLGENSHLPRNYLQRKLQVIRRDGPYTDQFAEKYFHSEQAILSYLSSEEGIDFLFSCLFSKLPERSGKPNIIQLVLHISSYYDVCESCAVSLFRESEVGRMFLRKLEDRLKSKHYLHPHNRILLLVSTSGVLPYVDRTTRQTTRPLGFDGDVSFGMPLVSSQNYPYIMRMEIGERK